MNATHLTEFPGGYYMPSTLEWVISRATIIVMTKVSSAALTLGFSLVVLTLRGLWCELAWSKFARKAAGLPLLHTPRHLVGNNERSFVYASNSSTLAAEAHRELGKTFGWMAGTRPAASTIDPDLIERIFCNESREHPNRAQLANSAPAETDGGIMGTQGAEWCKLRKAFEPALSHSNVNAPYVVRRLAGAAGKLVGLIERQLGTRDSTLVVIDDLVHRYTLDVLLWCLYKQEEQINFDHEPSRWVRHVDNTIDCKQQGFRFKLSLVIPRAVRIFDMLSWRSGQQTCGRRAILKFADCQIEQRLRCTQAEAGDEHTHFIDTITDRHLNGELTKRDYANCLNSLIGIADTTTRDALVYTLYLLALYGDTQAKLRNSIKLHGTESDYLSCVIYESLRMRPPVPFGCSRVIGRDIKLRSGLNLSAGLAVVVPTFALHRSEELWGSDAAEFKPERWLEAKFHPCQYLPFGTGTRQCPGRALALVEMKVLLEALLSRYTFESKLKLDVHKFYSPHQHHIIPSSPTYLTIKRLQS